MSRENNFLIGKGEILTKPVTVPTGGGGKNSPYNIEEAKDQMVKQLKDVQKVFSDLPALATPKEQVIACMTMHPRYISKSDFPEDLLRNFKLRAVGSKTESITPRKWGIKKHPETAITETYYIAGNIDSFKYWQSQISNQMIANNSAFNKIMNIEQLRALRGIDKLKGQIPEQQHYFEFVLHNDNDPEITELFFEYVRQIGGEANTQKTRVIDGLTFVPVSAEREVISQIADFSFVRVARGMPSLRPFKPVTRAAISKASHLILPSGSNADENIKTVIFDGGLPNPQALNPWVNYIEPPGIGLPVKGYLEHGLAVTGAYLFGPLDSAHPLAQPITKVDHVRVLDVQSGQGDDQIVDVLDRITSHLDGGQYDLVNISLGPDISIEDDDITLWTASLDKRFANGKSVATVAAGNNGQRDAPSGLNRIQIPSDAVNVLCIGAADRTTADWERAKYSAVGPGRCPGRAKPDVLAFGGSHLEPFYTLQHDQGNFSAADQQGTSFAAPLALRSISALRSMLGKDVGHLALRALMVHHAHQGGFHLNEVGWGKAEIDPLRMITTEDNEAVVLYQGDLLVGQHLRIPVPIQNIALTGPITLKATLVISPEVDIQYPGAYTRSGVEVTFRPHDRKYIQYKDGKISTHPKTYAFFSKTKVFSGAEYIGREDGHKWEPTLKHEELFKKPEQLSNPVFDVYYHYRERAKAANDQQPIPYALLISVKADEMPNLYNQVIRNYASILQPYRPQNRIQLSI